MSKFAGKSSYGIEKIVLPKNGLKCITINTVDQFIAVLSYGEGFSLVDRRHSDNPLEDVDNVEGIIEESYIATLDPQKLGGNIFVCKIDKDISSQIKIEFLETSQDKLYGVLHY